MTHPSTETNYNGWANYETWNVALWIGNDDGLYNEARRYRHKGYRAFASALLDTGRDSNVNGFVPVIYYQTPDGVAWNDPALDIEALDAMLSDL